MLYASLDTFNSGLGFALLRLFPQTDKKFYPQSFFFSSGGIGRSGTFLTAYGAYSHFLQLSESNFVAKEAEPICLVKTVKEFRGQRHPWMVEGPR